jgi:CRISPR/Cas system-associated exonuclease Cas4 (RecB family)
MRGYIDVYDPDTNTPIEIKTCNARSFDIRKEKMEPALYQMRQLLVYMHVKKSKLGLMVYECRDTFETLIIPIVMTDERQAYIERVFEWMKEVEKTKTEGLVKVFPGKRVNSKICSQCPVKAACDAAGEGVLEIPLLNKYAEAE